MVADKLSDLGDKVQALEGAVADTHHVGEVTKAHDTKTDAERTGCTLFAEMASSRKCTSVRTDSASLSQSTRCAAASTKREKLMEPRQQFS